MPTDKQITHQKLEPCPFCGSEAEHDSRHWNGCRPASLPEFTGHAVYCSEQTCIGCPQFSLVYETFEEAAEAWNQRAALAHASGDGAVGVKAGIYIASKTKHGPRWEKLRAQGVPVVSSWIDEYYPGATEDWADLWERCVREASSAKALILYREAGEVLKGAWLEAGAALAHGVPVFAVGCDEFNARHHPGVRLCETFDAALQAALTSPSTAQEGNCATCDGTGYAFSGLDERMEECPDCDTVQAAHDASSAQEAGTEPVGVKALNWKGSNDALWYATTVVGQYQVRESDLYGYYVQLDGANLQECIGDNYKTQDAAKAAAQADYEARIRSALSPSPVQAGAEPVELKKRPSAFIVRHKSGKIGLFEDEEYAQTAAGLGGVDYSGLYERDGGAASPPVLDAWDVERLAQWLHDEVEWPDPDFPNHSWPEHPDDTGQRGDGWLKIIPKDTQEQFRDIARRLLAASPNTKPGNGGADAE